MATDTLDPRMQPPPRLGGPHLAAGAAAFLALTAGVLWYQLQRVPAGAASPTWSGLSWGYLPFLLLAIPVESGASALRMWLLCRVLGPAVGFWTCVRAEWANVAISLLTPSQSGGGAGQIYVLSRAGVRVGTALTASLISFASTMVGLLVLGLYSLFGSGLAGGPLVGTAVWSIVAITAAMAGGALCPGLLRRAAGALSRAAWRLGGRRRPLGGWWPPAAPRTGPPADCMGPIAARLVDLAYGYRDDLRRFVRRGRGRFVAACALSLVFLLARCLLPYLWLRFLGIDAPARQVVENQMALVFLVFFAPTPGGAGVAEGASFHFMADVMPPGYVPLYTLLWRVSTAYLPAVAGLVCLGHALLADARAALGRPPARGVRVPRIEHKEARP